MSAILLEDTTFSWSPRPGSFSLRLDRFELAKGESVLLTGPSGSGKSTLLGMICGTLVPDSGSISVLEQPFSTLSGSERDRFRADHFGIIFQMFNLLPYLSILDNVLIPLHFSNKRRLQAGDLAYFKNKTGKVTHVGILDENGGIIHASGHVRRDQFTREGIYREDIESLTHPLFIIKRL